MAFPEGCSPQASPPLAPQRSQQQLALTQTTAYCLLQQLVLRIGVLRQVRSSSPDRSPFLWGSLTQYFERISNESNGEAATPLLAPTCVMAKPTKAF